jgi:CBS domain containing-hemolysin-like protein
MSWELILALLLVVANGFFVAVEFSLARLRLTQVHELLRQGKPGAKSAAHGVEHLDAFLSACQLGITVASLGLGVIGERAFHHLLEPSLGDAATIGGFGIAAALAFLIITTLHVVLGELSPKSLAIARTPQVVLALAPPMRVFYLSAKPLVDLLNAMGNLVLKPFGVPPASEAGHQPHSEDELRELLRESSREGLIQREEQELSEAALVFGDLSASEAMTHRSEIDLVLTTDSADAIADRAIATGRTRLPLCEPHGGLESAVGVINAKDLLPFAFDDTRLPLEPSQLARPLGHVSESARLDDVLREMRQRRFHPALVHDLDAEVIGLLTMEDILEKVRRGDRGLVRPDCRQRMLGDPSMRSVQVVAALSQGRGGDRRCQGRNDHREGQAERWMPDVREQHLGGDVAEDRRQGEIEVAEPLEQLLQHEVEADHAQQAEGVRREDYEGVAGDREDRRNRVDREHQIEGRHHRERGEQRRRHPATAGQRGQARAVVFPRHRDQTPKQPHREGRLGVDFLATLPRDLDGSEGEHCAQRVGGRLEGIEHGRPGDDEHCPEHDRQADAAQEHQAALLRRHREEREQHGEDEEVVEGQRLLDQEAGQILTSRCAIAADRQHNGEPEAREGPGDRPEQRGAQRRSRMPPATQVKGKCEGDECSERDPGEHVSSFEVGCLEGFAHPLVEPARRVPVGPC